MNIIIKFNKKQLTALNKKTGLNILIKIKIYLKANYIILISFIYLYINIEIYKLFIIRI
jgi:hypothetical protein